MPIVQRLISRAGAGVGAVSEYSAHRKEKKAAPTTPSVTPDPTTSQEPVAGLSQDGQDAISDLGDSDSDDEFIDDDETAWTLHESTDKHEASNDEGPVKSEDHLVEEVMTATTSHYPRRAGEKLPCPVIIPQKRPGTKTRGFVRAYAPVLLDIGIDQPTFMTFLDNFDKSLKGSSVYTVIEVCSIALSGAVPGIGTAAAVAVRKAARASQQLQSSHKSNTYLDRINAELFMPAGVVAFMMKYKIVRDMDPDEIGVVTTDVDLTTNKAMASMAPGSNGLQNQMKKFKVGKGTTTGAEELPECAPLIFPDVDAQVQQHGKESFKAKAHDASTFLSSYFDRRQQMRFAQSDPQSALMLPEDQRQMKSKMADPQHPMYNNGVLGLLSGGMIKKQDHITGRVTSRVSQHHDRILERHGATKTGMEGKRPKRGPVSRLMSEDVLYLMVANIPDDVQL